ncbi:hypothetical protein BM221_004857 [Beauveria bassiana]|uniref:Uncharacterized protein n=1 Tax=Beauveria bassiana TaxID=176275 RepID=A0A2N6NSI1_BEABA|nr:hypothetical protein BM221_004857 [Beauveria bassiana]
MEILLRLQKMHVPETDPRQVVCECKAMSVQFRGVDDLRGGERIAHPVVKTGRARSETAGELMRGVNVEHSAWLSGGANPQNDPKWCEAPHLGRGHGRIPAPEEPEHSCLVNVEALNTMLEKIERLVDDALDG